jgi:hypothetical protein
LSKIWLILFLIIGSLNANGNRAFINIISNVEGTTVFLDGKKIGKTPIKQYEVVPNKDIYLKAVVDKNYFRRDIKTNIKINNRTIPTFSLKFQKADAKIFLVGDNAELYIDDKLVKKLNDTNRVITVKANNALKIRLEEGNAEISFEKDIKANSLNTLKYVLVTTPKAVRLYTTTINNLMWEDTKDAVNTNINWENANTYCAKLEIANYDDFRLPTIVELEELYQNKDKIYNGYGGKFYWSSSVFDGDHNVWNYSIVKNFEDGNNKKSIKEFEQGRVRCVREIESKKLME